jgi:hypothetical protein
MTKPMSFEMSADTRLLRQELAKVKVGETISYEKLSAAISKNVSGGTASLQSARNSLLKNDRIVFAVVRCVGLQRLGDEEIVDASQARRDSIRRGAKRAAREITCVADYSSLSAPKQLLHTAALSVFTAIAEMSSDKGVERVKGAAQGRSGELPIAQTLAAFTS